MQFFSVVGERRKKNVREFSTYNDYYVHHPGAFFSSFRVTKIVSRKKKANISPFITQRFLSLTKKTSEKQTFNEEKSSNLCA